MPAKKALLISMPFGGYIPSTAITCLRSFASQYGHIVDILHPSLQCFQEITPATYRFVHLLLPSVKAILPLKMMYPDWYNSNQATIDNTIDINIKTLNTTFFRNKAINTTFFQRTFRENAFNVPDLMSLYRSYESYFKEMTTRIDVTEYDIIGFTTGFAQLMPSLQYAKYIKAQKRWSNKIIVFGGFEVWGERGKLLLDGFSEVDFVIDGEGEIPFLKLLDSVEPADIPGLIYRSNGNIVANPNVTKISIEDYPNIDYDSYFSEISTLNDATRWYIYKTLRIPIQSSRGCWWNKCTFCNFAIAGKSYQHKSASKVANEINYQSRKYNCLKFSFADPTLPMEISNNLFTALASHNRDYSIEVPFRANQINSELLRAMRQSGFQELMFGAEAFSSSLLRKMQKGFTVYHNIKAIKLCLDYDIPFVYTLAAGFPYEDEADYDETLKNLSFLDGFPPPLTVFHFSLAHGSYMFENRNCFGITEIHPPNYFKILLPPEIIPYIIPDAYDYKLAAVSSDEKDEAKFNDRIYNHLLSWAELRNKEWQSNNNKYPLSILDGYDYSIITDMRNGKNDSYSLNFEETQIYRAFSNGLDISEITEPHNNTLQRVSDICEEFVAKKLMFKEGNHYLSLAIRSNKARIL